MTVCSWCSEVIDRPTADVPAQAVNHGLCRACLSRELVKLRRTVSPQRLVFGQRGRPQAASPRALLDDSRR